MSMMFNKDSNKSTMTTAKSTDGGGIIPASPMKKKTTGQRIYRKIVKTTMRVTDKISSRYGKDHDGINDCLSAPGCRIVDIDEISIPAIKASKPTPGVRAMMSRFGVGILDDTANVTKAAQHIPDALSASKTEVALAEETKIKMSTILGDSPQAFLDAELTARGYSTERYNSLETGYYNSNGPSQLQLSSYGVRLLEMIDQNDEEGLESCLLAGIHSNPCNEYNQSILHKICHLGNVALLDILLENTDGYKVVQIADDFGRTPLHEACSSTKEPSFTVIETVLMHDPHLFYIADASGALPLELVEPEYWYDYMQFLQKHIDRYWPNLIATDGGKRTSKRLSLLDMPIFEESDGGDIISIQPPPKPPVLSSPPPLTLVKPGSQVPSEPEQPLSVELAWMVSSGVIEPEEAVSYMDPVVMHKFLPSIQKRLNQMALEEEMKERLHNQAKQHDYVDYDNNKDNNMYKDDLTV